MMLGIELRDGTYHYFGGDEPETKPEVTITQERLEELERAEAVLAALENGGVDNWDWYSEALDEAGIDREGYPKED